MKSNVLYNTCRLMLVGTKFCQSCKNININTHKKIVTLLKVSPIEHNLLIKDATSGLYNVYKLL